MIKFTILKQQSGAPLVDVAYMHTERAFYKGLCFIAPWKLGKPAKGLAILYKQYTPESDVSELMMKG